MTIQKNGISYTILQEWFKYCFHSIDENIFLYSTHSRRLGGASTAANVGVLNRLFKAHGRLKSETAKDMYIILSLNINYKLLEAWN